MRPGTTETADGVGLDADHSQEIYDGDDGDQEQKGIDDEDGMGAAGPKQNCAQDHGVQIDGEGVPDPVGVEIAGFGQIGGGTSDIAGCTGLEDLIVQIIVGASGCKPEYGGAGQRQEELYGVAQRRAIEAVADADHEEKPGRCQRKGQYAVITELRHGSLHHRP